MDIQSPPLPPPPPLRDGGEAVALKNPAPTTDALPFEAPVGTTDLSLHPAVMQQLKDTGAAAPTEAAKPPPPASKVEIDALRLLLSTPENQALIQAYGGNAPPLGGNAVADSIVQRYGPELAAQLQQLYTAQKVVQAEYLKAMDSAASMPLTEVMVASAKGETVPGWRFNQGSFWEDPPRWEFDPQVFTRDYAAGDSTAQKAFAGLHGSDALQKVTSGLNTEGEQTKLILAGQVFNLGHQRSGDEGAAFSDGIPGWDSSRFEIAYDRMDPNDPPELINNDAVWFDPERGWVTDPANLKPDWIDQAFPVVFTAVFMYWAGPVIQAAGQAVGGAVGSSLVGYGVTGMLASGISQFIATGEVDFGKVMQGALTAGIREAIGGIGDFDDLLGEGNALSSLLADGQQLFEVLQDSVGGKGSFGDLLLQTIGRAAGEGVMSRLQGGDFGDSFIQSVLSSVAGQISGHLGAQIDANTALNDSQRSMLRLFNAATASALRALGDPNDPALAFAQDFLTSILPKPPPVSTEPEGTGADTDTVEDPSTGESAAGQPWPGADGGEIPEWLGVDSADLPADPFLQAETDGSDWQMMPVGYGDQLVATAKFLDGYREGVGFSILQSGEALVQSAETLMEFAKNPMQFVNGVAALMTSPDAWKALGQELTQQLRTDLAMFKDAYEAGDMHTAGQHFGKLTADIAQMEVGQMLKLGVSLSTKGGRLIYSTMDAVAESALRKTPGLLDDLGKPIPELSKLSTAEKQLLVEVLDMPPKAKFTYDKFNRIWESKAGLQYGWETFTLDKRPNRIDHVLRHLEPIKGDDKHTVFDVPKNRLFGLIDGAWQSRGAPEPKDPSAYVIKMPYVIGTKGETHIRIVVYEGTSKVRTAYPFVPKADK